MTSITTQGMGSGLDIANMVENLVKADLSPLQKRFEKKVNSVTTELTNLGQLKSSLSTLQSSMSNLSKLSQFYKMKCSLNEQNYFSAKVSEKAQPGVYQVKVNAIAQAQSLSSSAVATSGTVVGNGNITVKFGTYSADLSTFTANDAEALSIDIAPENNTLVGIRDAINLKNAGVKASIVQDSSGARLSLTSAHTGVDYAMQITGDIAALNYDPTTNTTSLTQDMAASNSIVTINGITINQNSNQLDDVIDGISLRLKQADVDKTITMTIENNQELLTSSINDFVKKYNDCISFINGLTGYNKEEKTIGYFHKDPLVKGLQLELYRTINDFSVSSKDSNGVEQVKILANLGITTYQGSDNFKHGLLEIDQTKLNEAIEQDYNGIGEFFAKKISASDPNISVKSFDTEVGAGEYPLEINTYTPAVSLSGTIGGILGSSKDGVTLEGSGKFKSLSIDVLGGSTGARGNIVVTDGLASKIEHILSTYLDKSGEIERRTTRINDSKVDLEREQNKIVETGVRLKKKYDKQWNALDTLIGRMKDTSAMLGQMLDNLPKLEKK